MLVDDDRIDNFGFTPFFLTCAPGLFVSVQGIFS